MTAETRVFSFAGMFGSDLGQEGTRRILGQLNGEDNVIAYGSAVSTDKINPNRYQAITMDILKALNENPETRIQILSHSLGFGELMHVLELISFYPQQFAELKQRLELVLIAPAGLINSASGAIQFIKRFIDVIRTQGPLPGLFRNDLGGIESTVYLPIQGASLAEMQSWLRLAYPQKTQILNPDFAGEIAWLNQGDYLDYFSQLKPNTQQNLINIDTLINQAARTENWRLFRKLLKQRAALLLKHIQRAYDGEHNRSDRTYPEQEQLGQWSKITALATLGIHRILKKMFNGEYCWQLRQLGIDGVPLKFVIPEFDVILPYSEIVDFLNSVGQPPTQTVMMENYTHSAHAFQGGILAPALRALEPVL